MSANDVSNGQRALWMVLITSLAAPFFASLVAVAMMLAGSMLDGLLPPRAGRSIGEAAVGAFAWGALPATIAALGLTPYVLHAGTYSWLHAAVAGVIAFTAAVILWPIEAGGALAFLSFLAGLVAIGLRSMLIRGRILRP